MTAPTLADEIAALELAADVAADMTYPGELVNKHIEAALRSALARLEAMRWRPIETAPKDKTPVLVRLKSSLPGCRDEDLWIGRVFVASHIGVAPDGFDIGWNFAAPVGMGGFPDKWIEGWHPLSSAPEPQEGGR